MRKNSKRKMVERESKPETDFEIKNYVMTTDPNVEGIDRANNRTTKTNAVLGFSAGLVFVICDAARVSLNLCIKIMLLLNVCIRGKMVDFSVGRLQSGFFHPGLSISNSFFFFMLALALARSVFRLALAPFFD